MPLDIKDTIYETHDYSIITLQTPHVDREDGGHVVIVLKTSDCTKLSDLNLDLARKLSVLSVIAGKSMERSLSENGVDIDLINYQVNGNWSVNEPKRDPLHMHLYGRSKSAKRQTYGEALFLPLPSTGFYNNVAGLNQSDIEKMRKYIEDLISSADGLI